MFSDFFNISLCTRFTLFFENMRLSGLCYKSVTKFLQNPISTSWLCKLLFKLSKIELIPHLGAPTVGNSPLFISIQSQGSRKWWKFWKFLKCDVIWVIFGYQSNNFLTWWPEIDERFEILSFTYLPMFNRFLRFGFFSPLITSILIKPGCKHNRGCKMEMSTKKPDEHQSR